MPLCRIQRLMSQPSSSKNNRADESPPAPLNIVRARGQYVYDAADNQYLDCINSVAHVGHCHPTVVQSAIEIMASKPESLPSLATESLELNYPSMLRQTLPSHLDSLLFCHSGTEAIDLSVQLARLHSNGTDVICIENGFHGATESVFYFSHKISKNYTNVPKWIHTIPIPYTCQDKCRGRDEENVKRHINTVKTTLHKIKDDDRKIACFLCEPLLGVMGCIIPPKTWFQETYKLVHEAGGLCIADEVQTGLGRIGSHFWSFQALEVVPDIVVIGKSIGNGYPFAVVATSQNISSLLGDRLDNYRCSAVMDSVGCSVLQILKKENLMSSAEIIGGTLKYQLIELGQKHKFIGEIRGQGLLIGIDIVCDQKSRQPSKEVAEVIVARLQEKGVIVANEGPNRNILLLMPPMCFSKEDSLTLVQKLDETLTEMTIEFPNVTWGSCFPGSQQVSSNAIFSPVGRIGILQCWHNAANNKPLSSRVLQNQFYDDPD